MMSKYWCILLFCFFIIGCHGQKKDSNTVKEKVNKNSAVVKYDSLSTPLKEVAVVKKVPGESQDTSQLEAKKVLFKKEIAKKKDFEQTAVAPIWDETEINFLKQTQKILLFHVRITEIGSRKLELDSQLSNQDQQGLIEVLLRGDSYPKSTENLDQKENNFEPNYQLLLEVGEERLTLMLDKDNLSMVVANLFGRESHQISNSILEYIEKIKKGE